MRTIDKIKWGGILAGGAYGYMWLQSRFDEGTQEASARILQASEDMEYELKEFGNLSEQELDTHIEEYEQKLNDSASLLRERTDGQYQIMGTPQAKTVFGDSDKETYAFGLKLLTSYNDAVTLADEESNKSIAERVFEYIDDEYPWLGPLILGGGGLVGVYYGKKTLGPLVERYTDEFRNEENVEARTMTSIYDAGVIISTENSLYENAAQYEVQMIEAEPDPSQPPSEQPTPEPGQGVEAPAKEMNRWLPDNIVGKIATVLAIGPMTVISLSGAGVDFIVNNTNLTRGEVTAGLAITIALVVVAAIVIEYGSGPIPAGAAFLTTALRSIGVRITSSAGGLLSGFNSSWLSGLGVTV